MASAECEHSVDLNTGYPVETVQACNVWLPQCPSYSMNVVVHIGKQRLSKPCDFHQILTSSQTKRRPTVLSTVISASKKCEWWGRREWAPVVRRRRNMRRPIPYRTRGTWLEQRVAILADQPLCRDELDEQLSSNSSPALVSAAACNSTGRWDRALDRLAAHVTWRAHYLRPAQLLRFLKSKLSKCACVKISASVLGILGDANVVMLWAYDTGRLLGFINMLLGHGTCS